MLQLSLVLCADKTRRVKKHTRPTFRNKTTKGVHHTLKIPVKMISFNLKVLQVY